MKRANRVPTEYPLDPPSPSDATHSSAAGKKNTLPRRSILVGGATFAAFVTPAMTILLMPQKSNACNQGGEGNVFPHDGFSPC